MLSGMTCWEYCRWYLHYLREPWGAAPTNWYNTQMLWAALSNVIPSKHMPEPKDIVFNLLRKEPEWVDNGDEIKRRMQMMSKD